MKDSYRVLIVASHPIQYYGPLFRLMAMDPRLNILVAYCSLQGADLGRDPEFGIGVAWDIPLLDGYPWKQVPNKSARPGLGRFWGLINPGLWQLIQQGQFDVVHVNGYAYASFWIAIVAAKRAGAALMLTSDAISLIPRNGRGWKIPLKRIVLPRIFGLAEVVCGLSSGTIRFFQSLGIPDGRIALTHYTVDNDRFSKVAERIDRGAVRQQWKIPAAALVILFCAKLVPWKRPQDVLRAFAQIDVPETYLVFAGDGPLAKSLISEAQSLGVADRVRILGFVNQMQLPEVYVGSDLLVLPSQYEPWGLVVNEAMVCGVPVVVSDHVGARFDLIREGETGSVFPVGDVDALAMLLQQLLGSPEYLSRMGEMAKQRMETWSYREHIEGFTGAVERAVALKRRNR